MVDWHLFFPVRGTKVNSYTRKRGISLNWEVRETPFFLGKETRQNCKNKAKLENLKNNKTKTKVNKIKSDSLMSYL